MTDYTVEQPENACYWRLLDEVETEIFQSPDAETEYGLTRQEALMSGCRVLATCQHLPAESRKILMGTSREYVLAWKAAKDGQLALLRVPQAALSEDAFEPLGPGIAVLGQAAVLYGELLDVEDGHS